MGVGILICGLNGCGKSTLGRALANKTSAHFIDDERLYFPETQAGKPYASPRPREEVERLLCKEVHEHPDFVFASVKGDYGEETVSLYDCAVVIEVPGEIRSRRIRDRSFQKFGSRMLPGGDLHRQEEAFFQMADSRRDEYVEAWLQTLKCPVIRVDGTRPVGENVDLIIGMIKNKLG